MTALAAPVDELNLVVRAGSPLDVLVPVLQSDGNPASLSGWSARAQVRTDWRSPTVLATLTLALESGGLAIKATAAETELWTTWPSLFARFDTILTDLSTVDHPFVAGWIRVIPTITR